MIEMYAIIAIALLGAGMALGIFVIVSIGTRREDRAGTLTDASGPGKAASAARAFHGLYTRTPQMGHRGAQQRDNLRVLNGGGLPS